MKHIIKFNEKFDSSDEYNLRLTYVVNDDTKDRNKVVDFIEYNGLPKDFIEIYDFMRKNYNRYPSKVVYGGANYSPFMGNDKDKEYSIELEVEFTKDNKCILWAYEHERAIWKRGSLVDKKDYSMINLKKMIDNK